MEEIAKVIDIEKIIRTSKSKIIRSLPGFIIRFITRVVRQDELNYTLHNNRNKTGVPFINGILNEWNIKIVVKGKEKIPDKGRFVFVANHPVGGIDALSFMSTIYHYFRDVISPSNQLFNFIPQLNTVILGVNVFGTNTKDTVRKFNRLFESDSQIMIFPAGVVSRRSKGKISDLVWQKTFITKAIQFKRDIIPVHISGRNSGLFYFIANLRKFLRIKMSVEILLLPGEMLKQKNSTVTVTFGNVIHYQSITEEMTHLEWAQKVKSIVYSMSENT